MVNYKTSDAIVSIVYGLLGSITVPKYKNNKPTLASPLEYVVINALPVDANVMQKCRVNVNYHVKDINGGTGVGLVPDLVKIDAGSLAVLTILEKVTSTNYLIDFEGQETIPEENLGEHYSNLKFYFKYINN